MKRRRRIDFRTKQSIIKARFVALGSLQEKANASSFKTIGRAFFVNDRTVNSIINRYKKLGGRLYPDPMKRINKNIDPAKSKKKLDAQDLQYILDPGRLKSWAAFSLEKRCALIKKELGKQITRVTLAKYYKRNQIKHIKPEYTIHTDQKDLDIHKQRLQFVPQLLEFYKRRMEIVYIDECTTNVWQKPSKLWLPKRNPFKIKLAT